MNESRRLEAIPDSEIDPQIRGVLDAGEQVYWQDRPSYASRWRSGAIFLVIVCAIAWIGGFAGDLMAAVGHYPITEFLMPGAIVGAFIGLIFWMNYRQHGNLRYALTSKRVVKTAHGKVIQEARPDQLQILSTSRSLGARNLRWRNLEDRKTYSEANARRLGFIHVEDAEALRRMLSDWHESWKDGELERAETSGEAFREQVGASVEAAGTRSAEEVSGVQRIVNPEHGFAIRVPSDWKVAVEQRYDGPLRIFGITLLPRITRPGTSRPWKTNDPRPWNQMTLRGGPLAGLNIQVNPGGGNAMPSEDEVLRDSWGKMLGVAVKFFEKDLDICGYKGFAAVREIGSGTNMSGFGIVQAGVISRQWWLAGHGVKLEIQAIAPADSESLQETVDRIVGSLQPVEETSTTHG